MLDKDYEKHLKLQEKRRDNAQKRLLINISRRPEDIAYLQWVVVDAERNMGALQMRQWTFETS
jgi:hypothetical protein